ncbi:hypothetical protein AC790_08830 [Pantoea sp. RIT-PI-b]|uniref:hypothetical protein n=1 Tax=Pantoea sp. RIT-PI-b TaxID=1681195 RepID=UPI0006A16031|nr:hypothetical protein [Pantoea sp. RIT-PI-b]KNC14295.1 hypothetical protein AC790_08830 [Pantoea sp. RIT-PI-b]
MISKVWKVFKEVAIGILLVLTLWLVIGGAYKKDIGNLSDWISAACNILMAFAAMVAMYKALRWFDSHKQNEAINLGKSLLTEYDSILSNIHKINHDLINLSSYRENRDEFNSVKIKVKDLAYRCIELDNNLTSASRWGLKAKNESIESSFKDLLSYCNLAWGQCVHYEHLISRSTADRIYSTLKPGKEDELDALMKTLVSNKLALPFDQIFEINHIKTN